MLTIYRECDRGTTKLDWLDSRHTFSFGNYYDRDRMGVSSLRVINEDIISPARGFPTHGHRDMEIISYVLDGALEHKDSMGNGSVIFPSDVQRMSAGTGITHSEFNHSQSDPVHLLQIWILPEKQGGTPSYEQKHFNPSEKKNQWRLVASPDGRDGSVTIHQDVLMYASCLNINQIVTYEGKPGRVVWIQVVRGQVQLNQEFLVAGDGVAAFNLETKEKLVLQGKINGSEILCFDLAA